MYVKIDRSARLVCGTLEVFGIVPKSKANSCEIVDYVTTRTPYGEVTVWFFKNRRGILMYKAFTNISGNTTLFELKGWASAIRRTMKMRFQML